MKIKGYNRIKRIDIKGWLSGGNSKIYAVILILFLAAVLFVLHSISSMNQEPAAVNAEPETESTSETEHTTAYVANNQRYLLRINKSQNFVTVYTMDADNQFTVVYDVFWASVNASVKVGQTSIYDKGTWYTIAAGGYGHYANRMENGVWIYSVPYYSQDISKLDTAKYNNLGKEAESGSVYVEAGKAKWIYENCGIGTVCEVYEDVDEAVPADLEPLETLQAGVAYDPSDRPESIAGAATTPIHYMRVINDVVLKVGDDYDPMDGASAFDINGNDISSYIIVEGTVDNRKAGVYELYYILNDNFGTSLSYYREVTVIE